MAVKGLIRERGESYLPRFSTGAAVQNRTVIYAGGQSMLRTQAHQ
jgi:hypothetical protein